MNYWTIKVFSRDGNTRITDKWLKDLPLGAQVEIDRRLRYLQTLKLWGRPYSAKRKGLKNDIHEVIINWKRDKYRPLGFFYPEHGEFILLVGAQEKDWKLVPITADDIAGDRRKLVLRDRNYAIKYFKDV